MCATPLTVSYWSLLTCACVFVTVWRPTCASDIIIRYWQSTNVSAVYFFFKINFVEKKQIFHKHHQGVKRFDFALKCFCFFILCVQDTKFSVMLGRVFLGWTSTKQRVKCLALGHKVLTYIQTVCKCYQQTSKVAAGKEKVKKDKVRSL